MGELSPVAKEHLSLIGKYDDDTANQWTTLMRSMHDAGVLEVTPDIMQADLATRAYQRFIQLDQVEYETLRSLLGAVDSQITLFQKEQQKKLDDYFEMKMLSAAEYRECCNALVEACNARLANIHNLLSVVGKSKFMNGQFFNKAFALAGFSRVARKNVGSGSGHEMERLAVGLREEHDELSLEGKATAVTDDSPLAKAKDADFSEVDEAARESMLHSIRTPVELGAGEGDA